MSLSKYFRVSGLDIALIFHHHHSKTFTTFLKPPILTSLSLADNFILKFTKKIEDTKCDIPQLPTRKLVIYLNKISSLYLSCQINCPFSPFKANPTTNTFVSKPSGHLQDTNTCIGFWVSLLHFKTLPF